MVASSREYQGSAHEDLYGSTMKFLIDLGAKIDKSVLEHAYRKGRQEAVDRLKKVEASFQKVKWIRTISALRGAFLTELTLRTTYFSPSPQRFRRLKYLITPL